MFFRLKPEEKIIISLRRHWFVLTLVLFRVIILFFLPFLAWFVISFQVDITDPIAKAVFWLISSLWWLFCWAGLAAAWINYYLDYWIVTNQRIISTYQKGLFRREVSELSFSKVQDLTVDVKGIIKTFINYGRLEVRTAGTFEEGQNPNIFVFEDIPKPYEVQNTLSSIHQDFVKRINGQV